MTSTPDDDLARSIAPSVMECLTRSNYFSKLDDLLSPADGSSPLETCDGTYRLSEAVLLAAGFDPSELGDIFAVLKLEGGQCDCEVLYNVAEVSRLRANYWRQRAAKSTIEASH